MRRAMDEGRTPEQLSHDAGRYAVRAWVVAMILEVSLIVANLDFDKVYVSGPELLAFSLLSVCMGLCILEAMRLCPRIGSMYACFWLAGYVVYGSAPELAVWLHGVLSQG